MIEKQKWSQKKWYEHKAPFKGSEVIQISTLTHIKRLKNLIPVQKTKLSLNCGCGNGEERDIFGPSIGVDISFRNVHSLVMAGGQGVVSDIEFLPFKDDTFDVVYGFGILHHLNDIRKGVSEAFRVAKKESYVGFGGENNGWCPFNYIIPFFYRNWKIEKGFYRIREGNLRKIFRQLGMKMVKVSKQGMTIYGMGRPVYKLTSLVEMRLSQFKVFNNFSGYCYIAGIKM